MRSELLRLYRRRLITQTSYRGYAASFNSAVVTAKRLRGTRAAELEAVIENLHNMAAAGMLTASRLPALFLTLDRNRQWWRSGPLLSYGQRVEFAGSDIVWEYYPGQGIELQVLGQLREGSVVLCRRSQIHRNVPTDGRRAHPAGGKPRWWVGVGVLLQVRRGRSAVDERDVPGDSAADACRRLQELGGPVVPRHRAQSATRIQCRSAEWCRHQDQARDAVCPVLVRCRRKARTCSTAFCRA